MSDLSALIDAMREATDNAVALGEFRNAAGSPNYEAINHYMARAIHIHGGEDVVNKDGTVTRAGIAVFPLSYCALQMLAPEERDCAYDLALSSAAEQRAAEASARQEWFESRFPEAARIARSGQVPESEPTASRESSDALGLEPTPNLVSRIFRRRRLRR